MAWQNPKIDWTGGDGGSIPSEADFNRIENNTKILEKTMNDLPETSGTIPNYAVSIDDFIGLAKGRKNNN